MVHCGYLIWAAFGRLRPSFERWAADRGAKPISGGPLDSFCSKRQAECRQSELGHPFVPPYKAEDGCLWLRCPVRKLEQVPRIAAN